MLHSFIFAWKLKNVDTNMKREFGVSSPVLFTCYFTLLLNEFPQRFMSITSQIALYDLAII